MACRNDPSRGEWRSHLAGPSIQSPNHGAETRVIDTHYCRLPDWLWRETNRRSLATRSYDNPSAKAAVLIKTGEADGDGSTRRPLRRAIAEAAQPETCGQRKNCSHSDQA